MVASISSALGITASISSGEVIEGAIFLTIWAKKWQVFLPNTATFSFHLHKRITRKVGRFLPKGWPQVPLKAQSFVSYKSLC